MNQTDLFKKYDVQVPRYTSYPTVPYWTDNPSTTQWIEELKKAFQNPSATWAMYLHIPFCETLCTFCGCNTVITKDHTREEGYISILHKEWFHYLTQVPELKDRFLRQIHLGGGTPTFLNPDNLKKMMEPILAIVNKDPNYFEASVEVDPRRTTSAQLRALREIGFTRVSMGVQDFDAEVQRLVNRIQPAEITAQLTKDARVLGYESVNYDLIYGLPKQDLEKIKRTIDLTIELKPDRIALYSFALVPWIKPAQRLFKDEDLPKAGEKRALYELSRDLLLKAGYKEIGMDHFALPSDSLFKSAEKGELHRNFMGYTDSRTDVLLGLGVSAISEAPGCFHQNEKVLTVYERRCAEGSIPTFRGHLLSAEDKIHREQILELMTTFEVEVLNESQFQDVKNFLHELIEDGLVQVKDKKIKITEKGRPFLRNACMAFDMRLRKNKPDSKVFSQAL